MAFTGGSHIDNRFSDQFGHGIVSIEDAEIDQCSLVGLGLAVISSGPKEPLAMSL
jgi:hypothetical protein